MAKAKKPVILHTTESQERHHRNYKESVNGLIGFVVLGLISTFLFLYFYSTVDPTTDDIELIISSGCAMIFMTFMSIGIFIHLSFFDRVLLAFGSSADGMKLLDQGAAAAIHLRRAQDASDTYRSYVDSNPRLQDEDMRTRRSLQGHADQMHLEANKMRRTTVLAQYLHLAELYTAKGKENLWADPRESQ
jgi:hypothetical protein